MKILFETQLRDDPKPKPEKSWPKIKDKYGERFYKMWNYYS